jgi:hypothetical protein
MRNGLSCRYIGNDGSCKSSMYENGRLIKFNDNKREEAGVGCLNMIAQYLNEPMPTKSPKKKRKIIKKKKAKKQDSDEDTDSSPMTSPKSVA